MFQYKKGLGVQENPLELPMTNVSVAKGDVLYFASGYLSNAYASVTNALLAGVAEQTIDNSGGSAGDYDIQFESNPLALYVADTADTMTQAYCGYNCALASASTVTSASQGTDITGVVRLLKIISTSKALCRLNFAGVADT